MEARRRGSAPGYQSIGLVHDRLREAILHGEIPAGRVVSQLTLAGELQAGRTPLREALRMLQREGLVVSEPNRRVRIAELSGDDAEELYVMRITLESVASRITVPTLGSVDVAALEGYMAQMDHYMRVGDRGGLREPHRAFHALLVRAGGDRVAGMISQLFDHADRYRRAFGAATSDAWAKRQAEHRGILEAAAAGDADLAATRLTGHYVRTAVLIFAALDPDRDLERLRTAIRTVAPEAEGALDGQSRGRTA